MTISATSPLGIGILGTGFGQKVHIPGFAAHDLTQVVAVYHRDRHRAEAIAATHGIPHACDRIEELLALDAVQAVSISTPPFLHYEMAKAALHAHKPVLLEKPATLTVAEAQTLADLAQTQGLITAMDFEYRFVPEWQYFAEVLHQGFVGTPYFISIDWLMSSRADASRPWNWYARADQGGGVLGALGSHTFDYVRWLFGQNHPRPVRRVQAHLGTAIAQRFDPVSQQMQPVSSDDIATIHLELAQGTPCQINLSSVSRCGRGHWVEVYGDQGTLVIGSANQVDYVHGFRVWGAHAGEELSELPIPERLAFPKTYSDGRIAPFVRLVDHWVRGLQRHQTLAPSLSDGLASQVLMDAAQRSHHTGTWVEPQP